MIQLKPWFADIVLEKVVRNIAASLTSWWSINVAMKIMTDIIFYECRWHSDKDISGTFK